MYNNEKNKLKALMSEDVWEVLKESHCFIAGGAITSIFCNREVNDVDVYLPNYESLTTIIRGVYGKGMYNGFLSSYKLLLQHYTKKSVLLKDTETDKQIQLIHFKFFDNVQDIFNTFDFTACMGAYDCAKEEFILHEEFLKHNSQRYLKFHEGTAFPLMSALRVDKYREKGYTISKPEYLRVLLTCVQSASGISSWEDFGEHIGGMYGIPVEEVFDTEKPFNLTEAIEQLSKIESTEKYKPVETEYTVVMEHLRKAHNRDREPTKYLKVVSVTTSPVTFTSCFRPTFEYKIGSIVNGGPSGIWYANEDTIYDNYYIDRKDTVVIELEPTSNAEIKDDVIIGDVYVKCIYKLEGDKE